MNIYNLLRTNNYGFKKWQYRRLYKIYSFTFFLSMLLQLYCDHYLFHWRSRDGLRLLSFADTKSRKIFGNILQLYSEVIQFFYLLDKQMTQISLQYQLENHFAFILIYVQQLRLQFQIPSYSCVIYVSNRDHSPINWR